MPDPLYQLNMFNLFENLTSNVLNKYSSALFGKTAKIVVIDNFDLNIFNMT